MNTDPASVYGTISDYGWESVALHFTEGSVHSMSSSGNTYWTVPITCSDQAAAVKFLDLMYSNQEIAHILTDGIEGVDYVKVDDTHITYPDGVTQENAGFYRVATMFGDRRHEYFWEPELSVEANDEWTAINEKNVYRSFGYAYDSSDMTNQIIAIGTVLDQYLPTLETGSIDDVEGTYDQMISALKTAGIDEVIADNQTQFNEWLSNQ